MAFNSFTKFFLKGETSTEDTSAVSAFLPLSSKLNRTRTQSDACSTHSDHDFSSTEAGDDIHETFVDFDEFASASSDEEAAEKHRPAQHRQGELAASCVYSAMMLLHMRSLVCTDDELHYGTCSIAELPSHYQRSNRSNTDASPADADSWRSSEQQRKCCSSSKSSEDECVLRAIRSILNKLTVEKFDALFEQLVTCGLSHSRHISVLMQEIFEKATTQHHFIPMYAELCVKLEKDSRIATIVEEADLPNNFRRLLLNECQNVFEQLFENSDDDSSNDEEILLHQKQRALGNVKLIGRLLVHGMLSGDVFIGCCERLLRSRRTCAVALESLVALVMVAGPKFDNRADPLHRKLDDVFADMLSLTKDKTVQPRNRFLIRDVLDARTAGWPSSARAGITPTSLQEARGITVGTSAVAKGQTDAQDLSRRPNQKPEQNRAMPTSAKTPSAVAPLTAGVFDVVAWRRSLASIFDDLASDKNIPAAVQRVRMQQVPLDRQAEQFMDILTRVVEERRGAVRRCQLAFLAGLAAAEHSALDRKECLLGIGRFFNEVYADLLNEVHRLPAIMKSEFMPTILTVLPADELYEVVPNSMRK